MKSYRQVTGCEKTDFSEPPYTIFDERCVQIQEGPFFRIRSRTRCAACAEIRC